MTRAVYMFFVAALCAMAVLVIGCPTPRAVIAPPKAEEAPPPPPPPKSEEKAPEKPAAEPAKEEKKPEEKVPAKLEDEEDKLVLSDSAKAAFNSALVLTYTDPEGAIRAYRQALVVDPNLPKAHSNIGLILEWQGKFAEAEAEYQKALEKKADYYPAMANLANLMVKKGNAAGAESYLKEKLGKFKQSLTLRNRVAALQQAQGRHEDAAKGAMEVLKLDEKNTAAMIVLAQTYFSMKKYELAQMVLDNAREVDPNIAMIWVLNGYLQLAQKNQNSALEFFRKALELRDDLPEVHNNLGYIFNQANDFANAIVEFRKALAYHPGFTKANLNLANSLRGSRKYEEAEAEYKKVLTTGKGGADVLFNLGILYLDMEVEFKGGDPITRYKTAREYLEKAKSAGLPADDEKRVAEYIKEAEKKIKQKEQDVERDKKRKIKDAEDKKKKEAEDIKKKEEDSKKAAELEKKKQEEDLKKRQETEKKASEEAAKKSADDAKKAQDAAAAKKSADDAAAKKSADDAKKAQDASAAKKSADDAAARKSADDAKRAQDAAAAKKAADDAAAKKAADQKKPVTGGKISDDEDEPKVLPTTQGSDKKGKSAPDKATPGKGAQPQDVGRKLDSDEGK